MLQNLISVLTTALRFLALRKPIKSYVRDLEQSVYFIGTSSFVIPHLSEFSFADCES